MAAPDDLTALTVTPRVGDNWVDITWAYAATGTPANEIFLEVFAVVAGTPTKIGEAYVERTIEPLTRPLVAPTGIWRIRATPVNRTLGTTTREFGNSTTATDATVTQSVTDITVDVTSASIGNVDLIGQGFLHGGTDAEGTVLSPALVPLLNPRWWRLASSVPVPFLRSLGITITQVLSDFWQTTHQSAGHTITPWSNWTTWETFVSDKVNEMIADDWVPDYLDIWNEPNSDNFASGDVATMTVANFNELFKRAHDVIRAIDPTIKLIAHCTPAPYWTDTGLALEFGGYALDQFLDYSETNSLTWDAIAWHENASKVTDAGDVYQQTTNVDRHVAMYKLVMADHPGVVTDDTFLINEYNSSATYRLAGWCVGYFRALEDSGAAHAVRAIWDSNFGISSIGGITSTYWVHQKYAEMADLPRMQVTSSSSFQVDGLAVQDDAKKAVRVMCGRHWGGAAANGATDASVALTVDWPYSTPAHAYLTRLPVGASTTLTDLDTTITTESPSGTYTVDVDTVHTGDAFTLELIEDPPDNGMLFFC